MRILITGDSRAACPLRPQSWPAIFEQILRQNNIEAEIYTYLHIEHVHIYTVFLLEDIINKYPDGFFDYIFIQSGWHDYVESWPKSILESIIPNNFNEKFMIDDSDKWTDAFSSGKSKGSEYRYIDVDGLYRVNDLLHKKARNVLYIGNHGIKDSPVPFKKNVESHHIDILESNDLFSKFGDYYNLPMHWDWIEKNTTHDRVHYTFNANIEIANYLYNYVLNRNLTINSIIHNMNLFNKDNYIVSESNKLNYNDFYHKSVAAGRYIASFTNEGDCVLIDGKTSIDQLTSFIGSILFKRIPMIIQTPSEKVSKQDFDEKMLHIKNIINPKICLSNNINYDSFRVIKYGFNYSEDVIDFPDVSTDDIAFYQLSSGTTGLPKLIKIKHKDIIRHTIDYLPKIGYDNSSVVVSWLPLYHDMGLIACFLLPLLCGSSIVHIDPFNWIINPQLLFDNINMYNGTHTFVPNFALNYLLERCDSQELPTIKKFVCCSEPVMKQYLENFKNKFGINVSICYALAENIFAVSHTDNIETDDTFVSCGELINNVSVIIVKDGKDVTGKDIGGVYIKSSYSEHGDFYGYYYTGDIGYIKNNNLFIIGRNNDKIISFGVNVYPDYIEQMVGEIDGVIKGRVACFGVFDESIGTERVYVCLESNRDVRSEVESIISSLFGVSSNVYIGDYIIKSSSGKISRVRTKNKLFGNLEDS